MIGPGRNAGVLFFVSILNKEEKEILVLWHKNGIKIIEKGIN